MGKELLSENGRSIIYKITYLLLSQNILEGVLSLDFEKLIIIEQYYFCVWSIINSTDSVYHN